MDARPATILSPHLDDAVLSCWHLLAGEGEVEVLNVFTGTPNPGAAAWWDVLTGASDPAARMDERRAEDREALALVDREARNLGFLDEQYEPSGQTAEMIAARLVQEIDEDGLVFAPAALGTTSGDHLTVRHAALELRRSGAEVCLYADFPHAVLRGWPSWVNGGSPRPDVDTDWAQRLSGLGVDPQRSAEVHHLDAAEQARKLEAVCVYRTQLPGLESMFGSIEGFPVFPHEIAWRLPPS